MERNGASGNITRDVNVNVNTDCSIDPLPVDKRKRDALMLKDAEVCQKMQPPISIKIEEERNYENGTSTILSDTMTNGSTDGCENNWYEVEQNYHNLSCRSSKSCQPNISLNNQNGLNDTLKMNQNGSIDTLHKYLNGSIHTVQKDQNGLVDTLQKDQNDSMDTSQKNQNNSMDTSQKNRMVLINTLQKNQNGSMDTSQENQSGSIDKLRKKEDELITLQKQNGLIDILQKKEDELITLQKQNGLIDILQKKEDELITLQKQNGLIDTSEKNRNGLMGTSQSNQNGSLNTFENYQNGPNKSKVSMEVNCGKVDKQMSEKERWKRNREIRMKNNLKAPIFIKIEDSDDDEEENTVVLKDGTAPKYVDKCVQTDSTLLMKTLLRIVKERMHMYELAAMKEQVTEKKLSPLLEKLQRENNELRKESINIKYQLLQKERQCLKRRLPATVPEESKEAKSFSSTSIATSHHPPGITQHPPEITQDTLGITQNTAGITQHTSGITEHTSGITQDTAEITQHTFGITQHTAGITQNTAGITQHTSGITEHTSGITQDTAEITQHTSGITQHTAGITQNTAGITQNTSGITQNTAGITQHTSGITQDTAGITQHPPGVLQNTRTSIINPARCEHMTSQTLTTTSENISPILSSNSNISVSPNNTTCPNDLYANRQPTQIILPKPTSINASPTIDFIATGSQVTPSPVRFNQLQSNRHSTNTINHSDAQGAFQPPVQRSKVHMVNPHVIEVPIIPQRPLTAQHVPSIKQQHPYRPIERFVYVENNQEIQSPSVNLIRMQVVAPNDGIRVSASMVPDMSMTPQTVTDTRPVNNIRPNITHNDYYRQPPILQPRLQPKNIIMNQQQSRAVQNATRPLLQNAVKPYTQIRPPNMFSQEPPLLPLAPTHQVPKFISNKSILLPRLSASISTTKNSIVLTWNYEKMIDKPEQIYKVECYQLFAHQASDAIIAPPVSSKHWKKIGVVNALPLPMACTLTQFANGSVYFFAVLAVDIHGREGELSNPCVIQLSDTR